MIPELKKESDNLQRSWDRHSAETLDEYLVINHEDPRINLQSILTRSFIIDSLWPNQYNDLISEELRFGTVLCWLIEKLNNDEERYSLLNTLSEPDSTVPQFIRETYEWLTAHDCPVSDYISDALCSTNPDHPEILLNEGALGTFQHIWSSLLSHHDAKCLSMIEFGPGSANDYRFLDSFGLARFVNYRGIDISRRNVENARRRYPSELFSFGNIFESGLPDDCTDYVLVHDLFEHFSPKGLEVSMAEVMRICKKEAWLNFFNAADCEEHEIEPVDEYFWNRLSIKAIVESLRKRASTVEVLVIQDILNTKFNYGQFYNPEAVTIIASK